MVHLPVLRYSTSFIQGTNLIIGTHEEVEENINKYAKYETQNERSGVNVPFQTEYKFMDYRLKEEHLSQFASDLNVINLNPKTNNITLVNLFFPYRCNIEATAGIMFRLIQYLFKWINRKYITSSMLLILCYLKLMSPILTLIFIFCLFANPLKPFDTKEQKLNFYTGWCYNFTFGYLKDMTDSYKHVKQEVMTDAL